MVLNVIDFPLLMDARSTQEQTLHTHPSEAPLFSHERQEIMPYFVRKPFEKQLADTNACVADFTSDEMPFSELARQVLTSEKGMRQTLDGPFRCRRPCGPGSAASLTLSLSADTKGGPVSVDFLPSDLCGPQANIIPATSLRVSPDSVLVQPGQSAEIVVSLDAPPDISPGLYRGKITGTGTEPTVLVVEFEITATD